MCVFQNLSTSWLQQVSALTVAHAFTIRVSQSVLLLHSAFLLFHSSLEASPAGSEGKGVPAAVRSSDQRPLPPLLTASTLLGGIARAKLMERLQQYVAETTQQRVTLQVIQ